MAGMQSSRNSQSDSPLFIRSENARQTSSAVITTPSTARNPERTVANDEVAINVDSQQPSSSNCRSTNESRVVPTSVIDDQLATSTSACSPRNLVRQVTFGVQTDLPHMKHPDSVLQGEDGQDNTKACHEITAYWSFRSMRLKIALVLCMAYFSIYVARTSMSVAMVCMVNSTALAEMNQENPEWLYANNYTNHSVEEQAVPEGCSLPDSVRSEYEGEFIWVPSEQSWVFAAIFWGSTLTTFATGFLSDRYGPKNLFIVSAVAVIMGTAFTPLAAHWSFWGVVLARLLVGVGSGLLVPATSTLVAQWFPPFERSTTAAMYTSGNQLASIIGNPVAAQLCSRKDFFGGWPAIFYLNVVVLGVFLLLWMALASSTPQENRFVSQKEKDYIGAATTASGNRKDHSKIPWKAIFTSPAMYAVFANNVAAMMGASFLQTYLPTYYKDVLLLDLSQNGFLSALPFVCMIAMKIASASVADFFKRTKRATPTTMCKICNSVAGFGSAACMAGLAMMDCSTKTYALVLSCLATCFLGGHITGFLTAMLMIAPRYAGLISAISMTLANISGALVPYIIGAVTPHGTAGEWRIVFGMMMVVLVSSAVIFLIWGSAEVQPWAMNPQQSSDRSTNDHERDSVSLLFAFTPPHTIQPLTQSSLSQSFVAKQ